MIKTKLINFNHLNLFNLKTLKIALGLILTIVVPSMLSAATLEDLKFTLINGDTEYSVSAVDVKSIAGAVEIPATHDGKPVTEIGAMGFGLNKPSGISDSEFVHPAITSVTIPSSIQVIGESAFLYCRSLSTITFAEGSQLTTIKKAAFYYCQGLISIDLPESLTTIEANAFSTCSKITTVTIPPRVTVLNDGIFSGCWKLTTVILHDKITEIKNHAFNHSGLTAITIPASVTQIGSFAFAYSDLRSVTFLGSAPVIVSDAFENMSTTVSECTFTAYDTYQASFGALPAFLDYNNDAYAFTFVPGPDGPAQSTHLVLGTSYNADTKALSIVTKNEPSGATLVLEHTTGLDTAWSTVSNLGYVKSTNDAAQTVTRTIMLDPDVNPSGFYRIVSEGSP